MTFPSDTMSVNTVHDILMEIRAETFRHPLLVGFANNETVKELKDRLKAIRAIVDYNIDLLKDQVESSN